MPKSHTESSMSEPWEVFDAVLEGHRKSVAKALKLSPTMVDKWCYLPEAFGGEGGHNPLERLIEIVRVLRASGSTKSEEIVRYFNTELGYLPPIKILGDDRIPTVAHVSDFLKESSEYLSAISDATRDGHVDDTELEAILRNGQDIQQVLAGFLSQLSGERERRREARLERIGTDNGAPAFFQKSR